MPPLYHAIHTGCGESTNEHWTAGGLLPRAQESAIHLPLAGWSKVLFANHHWRLLSSHRAGCSFSVLFHQMYPSWVSLIDRRSKCFVTTMQPYSHGSRHNGHQNASSYPRSSRPQHGRRRWIPLISARIGVYLPLICTDVRFVSINIYLIIIF